MEIMDRNISKMHPASVPYPYTLQVLFALIDTDMEDLIHFCLKVLLMLDAAEDIWYYSKAEKYILILGADFGRVTKFSDLFYQMLLGMIKEVDIVTWPIALWTEAVKLRVQHIFFLRHLGFSLPERTQEGVAKYIWRFHQTRLRLTFMNWKCTMETKPVNTVVETCWSQGSHALKHSLL